MQNLSGGSPSIEDSISLTAQSAALAVPGLISVGAQAQLTRMFRDPNVLEKSERKELVAEMKEMVALHPKVPELRVLLGMVLCVDFDIQPAMEELKLSVEMAPDNFLARLKYAELLMRLRICTRAAEETHKAALLAANPVQSEMARRQAAAIRTMLQQGIERGGYTGMFSRITRLWRKPSRADQSGARTALSLQ